MRLRPQDLRTINLRQRVNTQDDEGNSVKGWGDAVAIEANVQPASGQLNASIYGERLAYMKNLKLQSDSVIENRDEGCGVCLDVEADAEPDYTIVSISTFATHKNVLIERLERGGDGR